MGSVCHRKKNLVSNYHHYSLETKDIATMRRIFKLLVLVCAINFVTARHVRRDVLDDNDDEDTVKKVAVEDEKSDETTDTNSRPDLLQAIRDALGGVVNALQGVVKAKQEAATPLIEAATRTVDTIRTSNAVDRIRETLGLIVEAKLNALQSLLKVATDTLGNKKVTERVGGTVDFAGNLVRVGVCHFVCPFQPNSTECRNDNCSPKNETSKEEKGDYEYFNYVDFEEAILELDTPSEEDVDDEAEEDNEVEDLAVEDLGDTTSVDERIQNL